MSGTERPATGPFRGVGVALLTLFDENGDLLAERTALLAEQIVAAGVAAVVISGTTGEAMALEEWERISLLREVRAVIPASSGVPLIAGTGAPSARQAARMTASAVAEGADAVLALSPPLCADPRPYYDEVTKAAAGVPVLAYHYPAVSHPGIPIEILGDLPVAGCKDSSGDAARLVRSVALGNPPIYVGSDQLICEAGAVGAAGAILALANSHPELCAAAFAGDVEAQKALAEPHARAEMGFPSGYKALASQRWGTPVQHRLGC